MTRSTSDWHLEPGHVYRHKDEGAVILVLTDEPFRVASGELYRLAYYLYLECGTLVLEELQGVTAPWVYQPGYTKNFWEDVTEKE